jgi:hypothetical protein
VNYAERSFTIAFSFAELRLPPPDSAPQIFGTNLTFYSSLRGIHKGVTDPLVCPDANPLSLNPQNPWPASSFPSCILQIRDRRGPIHFFANPRPRRGHAVLHIRDFSKHS